MRRLIAPAMAGLLLAALVPGVAVGATLRLDVVVGEDCVEFQGAAKKLHTLWLLEGGVTLDRVKATADDGGYGWVCFDYTVASGHRIKIQPAGLTSRTVTVLNVSAMADRASDVVSGNGPNGSQVRLVVYRYRTGTYVPKSTIERSLKASSSGAWSIDLTSAGGIRGGDDVWAGYTTSAGDTFWAYRPVEQMAVVRGASYGLGYINRGEVATLTLLTSTGAVRGKALLTQMHADGTARGPFWTSAGKLIYVRSGDKVKGSFAPDAAFTVPAITVKGVTSTDVVTVSCPGMVGQGVRLYVESADGSKSVERIGTINSSGVRAWDITAAFDLRAGDYMHATCKTDPGDEIYRHSRIPS